MLLQKGRMSRFFLFCRCLTHILTRSHKSHLLNSCLRSKIILRLFFTVAAQWWVCKRYFFLVRYACLVTTRRSASPAQLERKDKHGSYISETGSWISYGWGGEGRLCMQWLLLVVLQTTGRLPHLSQLEHIYISSPQGILQDEVSSNWIWISLHQG